MYTAQFYRKLIKHGLPSSHWKMNTSIWWYLRILPVLQRPEVVDIDFNTI